MFQTWVNEEFKGSIGLAEQWLRHYYQYRDEEEEIIRTPEAMLQDFQQAGYIEGDCDDVTTFAASITKVQGFNTRLTAIKANNMEEFDHVFSEVKINGTWIPIDITVPSGTDYHPYGVMSELV